MLACALSLLQRVSDFTWQPHKLLHQRKRGFLQTGLLSVSISPAKDAYQRRFNDNISLGLFSLKDIPMKSDLLKKKNTTSNPFEKLDISNTESCFIKLLLLCFHCNNNNNIQCSRT